MYKNAKILILFVVMMMPAMMFSQDLNKKVIDPRLDKEILYGYCDRYGLEKGEFGKLFKEYYDIYEPDQSVINQLKQKKEGVEILIILGTWCSDSQEQVPKFFKVLDKMKFNKKSVEMICVSRDKEAGVVETVNYNIQKIPTFIIYKRGREIGRIVETPYTTLEKDLLMFFSD
jgi:thiol-disulfide isomerase/thioredoxin